MARTKKLTDPIYSPTNPTSEAAIRAQIDDSIQEVYDQSSRNDATVNLTGDQTVVGIKTFSSSPIVPTPTTSTQVANKAYVDGVAISATIPLDSLTDEYLASAPGNIKPRVATLETNFSTAQTDITNLETDIDIITTAVSDTGLVNAMVVNTAGTFDMAKNGNVTPFIIPLFTNTATTTLSIDGGAVTEIRKANDTGTLVALEAGDIKKNVPTQFVLDTVSGFFVYAPKGGSNIKSIQQGDVTIPNGTAFVDVSITSVNTLKSYPKVSFKHGNDDEMRNNNVSIRLLNSTTIRIERSSTVEVPTITWTVIEFNNVKSLQSGSASYTSTTSLSVAISNVNLQKSDLIFSYRISTSGLGGSRYVIRGKLNNATQLLFDTGNSILTDTAIIEWFVIEFN